MKISIIGMGYVGLVTGVSLAEFGHKVGCIDIDEEKISMIKNGKSHFFEPGIEKSLNKVLKNGNLSIIQDVERAVLGSDISIITVGTPTVNNKIDLSFIKKASRQIGKALEKTKKYHIVVVKSTVLPGVTEKVVKPILEKYSKKKVGSFGLCMNPEFLREGSALKDALYPDRIVIGHIDKKSGLKYAKVYKKLSCPKIFTNLWTAELIKYVTNSLFATLISYANEIARISESIGKVDVIDVWRGVHLDKRLNHFIGGRRVKAEVLDYIFSGCGFGGSCFPKDIKALSSFADELGVEVKLIKSVIDINQSQPYRIILLLKDVLGKNLSKKKIAVLGLSFKPNTDDIRESPAFPIIEALISEGAEVIAHDPIVYKKRTPLKLKNLSVVLANNVQEAVKNTDAAVIVTAWKEYANLSAQFFTKNMKHPIVVDGRRIYNKNSFISSGIIYKGIGL
jgi:UDPglucose 6-dehydrogenase/GDP-mannose 6-dehydrogenase